MGKPKVVFGRYIVAGHVGDAIAGSYFNLFVYDRKTLTYPENPNSCTLADPMEDELERLRNELKEERSRRAEEQRKREEEQRKRVDAERVAASAATQNLTAFLEGCHKLSKLIKPVTELSSATGGSTTN